jgi:hypothetical protein
LAGDLQSERIPPLPAARPGRLADFQQLRNPDGHAGLRVTPGLRVKPKSVVVVTDDARSPVGKHSRTLVRLALALQLAFLLAVLVALGVTLASTGTEVRLIALAAVLPIVGLTVFCLRASWIERWWGFVGAGALGIVGVGLRLAVNTDPGLEVGGGLPVEVTVLYVVMGSLVTLSSLASAIQMHRWPSP